MASLGVRTRTLMILEVFFALLAAIVVLNVWTTWRVARDDLSSLGQRVAQFALIWCVPCLGALVVLHLQRREPERASGRYPIEHEPPDDYPGSRRVTHRNQEALDGDA